MFWGGGGVIGKILIKYIIAMDRRFIIIFDDDEWWKNLEVGR